MAVIDLVSRREVNDPSLPLERIAERHRRLGLFEGQPVVLEYTQLDAERTPECDGYVIEAGMHFDDPPEVADARLSYDMWLIRTDEKGSQTAERIESQAGQRKSAEFGFAPMWFDADGSENPAGPVGIDVYGTIRGNLRPDGTVHLQLGAVRFVRDRMRSGTAEAGGKSADLRLGDTIEVQLPPVSGRLAPFGSLSPIFRGQKIAVRVTPRRVS